MLSDLRSSYSRFLGNSHLPKTNCLSKTHLTRPGIEIVLATFAGEDIVTVLRNPTRAISLFHIHYPDPQ
jgi:hypothetical protein